MKNAVRLSTTLALVLLAFAALPLPLAAQAKANDPKAAALVTAWEDRLNLEKLDVSSTFTLMTYASRTGTFSALNLPPATPEAPWVVVYGATSLVLEKLDSDHDGWGDSFDCAPFDPGAFALPGEITGEAFAADKQTLSWNSAVPSSGPATVHDAMRSALNELPVGGGGAETCLASGITGTSITDGTVPTEGSGFYYLVRGRNVCGAGTYGTATSGSPRTSSVCP